MDEEANEPNNESQNVDAVNAQLKKKKTTIILN